MGQEPSAYEQDMLAVRERLIKKAEGDISSLQTSQDSLELLARIAAHVERIDSHLDDMGKCLKTSVEMIDNLYNIADLINKRIARHFSRHDGVGES